MEATSLGVRAGGLIESGPWRTEAESPVGALLGRARAIRRGLLVLGFTLVCMPVQAVLLLVPGQGKAVFPRLFWAGVCRLIGLRVRVVGRADRQERPVVFASNHSSWLDILVLGGTLEACFISKAEVGRWPLVRTLARLGRTVFVTRRARDTGRERDAIRGRLLAGDSLVLFPEGTSSDGSRVLPFRSAFFSALETGEGAVPLIQPVSVVYDQVGGLPIGRASRPVFAWYGDMALGPHFWRLAQLRGLRATVLVHGALEPGQFGSRKAMAAAVWETVAAGAAALRQNRPAVPRSAPGSLQDGSEREAAAFA